MKQKDQTEIEEILDCVSGIFDFAYEGTEENDESGREYINQTEIRLINYLKKVGVLNG